MTTPPAATREPQYQRHVELRQEHGLAQMGMCASQTWRDDPKRLTFVLARYKFVAKMLEGNDRVLEVGCGDAFGSRIVKQAVTHLTATDFDPLFIQNAAETSDPRWPMEFAVHDMLAGPFPGRFTAAYSCDVLEHIPVEHERTFLRNIVASLEPHGVLLIGTPSLESQPYASALSRAGHVNCKTQPALQGLMREFFHQVFLFGMNDEVVHTGFAPLAHYRFALGCSPRR